MMPTFFFLLYSISSGRSISGFQSRISVVETELAGLVEQPRELDGSVALHTWVRGPSVGVIRNESVDHPEVERILRNLLAE